MSTPKPGDKVIDSRDVIARFEELQSRRDVLEDATQNTDEWDFDDEAEYETLKELIEECEGCGDWEHGETLIHRNYWVEYCQQLLEDIGYIPKDFPSWIVIDWEATADNLEYDYYVVDFGDEEYLIRSC
jgi:hypothetical protein